jgi:hypothetical protein
MGHPEAPPRSPEIHITPQPESALRQVTRVDVAPFLGLVLCPGAEGWYAFYNYPDLALEAVESAWVTGLRTHRGRTCLEVFYRYLSDPERGTWGHELYRVTPEEILTVYTDGAFFYEGRGSDFGRGHYSKRAHPERRILRLGDRWQDPMVDEDGEEEGRCDDTVEGPVLLTSPAGSWPCLCLVECYANEGHPEGRTVEEHYIAESGRTLLRRSFESDASVHKTTAKADLLRAPCVERNGVNYWRSFDCLPDFVLGLCSPDRRWPEHRDKWPPRER